MEQACRVAGRGWWIVIVVLSGIGATPLWASDCESGSTGAVRMELRDGQDRVECRTSDYAPEDIYVTGSGRIGVTFLLEIGSEALEQLIVDGGLRQRRYRTELLDPQSHYFDVGVTNLEDYPESWPQIDPSEGTVGEPYELVIVVQRVVEHCSMRATVSGDVGGTYFGDVAYFNVFEEGVAEGLAAGTALDPTAHEALGGLAEFGAWVSDFLEDDDEDEEGDAGEDASGDNSNSEPAYIWGDEWDVSGTDTFGLTLVDVKFDVDDGLPDGDQQAAAGFLGAMAVLGSTFSLSTTGVNMSGPTEPGLVREVELTTLIVAPGVMDANISGVKFFWKKGEPGYAKLRVEDSRPGYLVGAVEGEAYTEHHYDGGKLKIKVVASFTALQGAVSCQ